MIAGDVAAPAARGRRRREIKLIGFDLYRSRPISRRIAARFPHTLYYAVHFDEESHKFAFLFLGPNAEREQPDVLTGLEAQEQWTRFVDVMVRDPVISGLRVERIGHHEALAHCLEAARADAGERPAVPA
ncbi:MAG TPA: hypothetical protein VFZ01_14755 [Geminicoccaceae bacterium]